MCFESLKSLRCRGLSWVDWLTGTGSGPASACTEAAIASSGRELASSLGGERDGEEECPPCRVLDVEILHEKYGPPDAYVDVLASLLKMTRNNLRSN